MFRKGTAEFYLKNYTAAEEVFKKILQLDPTGMLFILICEIQKIISTFLRRQWRGKGFMDWINLFSVYHFREISSEVYERDRGIQGKKSAEAEGNVQQDVLIENF